MDHSFIQNNVDELGDSSLEVVDELVEMVDQVAPASLIVPSYRPTQWDFVNNILDRVDLLTKGRAGTLVKFITFLVIGGFTTIINLAIVWAVYYKLSLPIPDTLHNLIAAALGSELSLIVNFMLNDKFTFNDAAGHDRPWLVRGLRFNVTGLVGVFLTIGIETGLSDLLHITPLVADAIAVIIVLFYNFSFHQIFTYRRIKTVETAA